VTVNWVAPDARGSPITAYTIEFKGADGLYYAQLTDCDGSNPTIRDSVTCSVSAYSLHVAPFNLPWNSEVWAKVSATNLYGTSDMSSEGNGATMISVPDAPVSLAEDLAERTGSTLGLVW